MPSTLPPDHPNLLKAVDRLRRIQYTWAALLFGMALLTVLSNPPVIPIHWAIAAVLLMLGPEPALLGTVATLWGLSLLGLVPELNQALAIDPVGALFGVELVESLALGFVRLVLLVMAWNQMQFYRMLYGAPAPSQDLPDIPPVIENHSDRLAGWALLAALGAGVVLLVAVAGGLTTEMLSTALGMAALAISLGIGVAFSPTERRVGALATVLLGGMLFVLAVAFSSP